jgi:beta-hydroxyacyl-ACP dehydratase FabZ
MLLVDRILESDGKKKIVGIKNVTANEPFFQGHFPGKPVMPGVLQVEAMAQTAGILLAQVTGASGGTPYFMSIDKAKFRKVVQPGDQLRMEVELLNLRATASRFKAKAFVGDSLVSEAEVMCMFENEGR